MSEGGGGGEKKRWGEKGRRRREGFFFFKQKTAYEIKECDWSSDVCSSDLPAISRQEDCYYGKDNGRMYIDQKSGKH